MLAAGMGSRFGGLKQCAPVGPNGETLLDYSVFDARHAGFSRVVFVIRDDFADEFKAQVASRLRDSMRVDCVVQRLDDLPGDRQLARGRHKPWGTAHAVLAARHVIDEPFAVINADDYYGRDAYHRVAGFLGSPAAKAPGPVRCCMVGYPLHHTLSGSGGVSRGICAQADERLVAVEEHRDIVADGQGHCHGLNLRGERVAIAGDALVSMNFWGFDPGIFEPMQQHFAEFLRHQGRQGDAECYIPGVIDTLIRHGRAECRVLHTEDRCFGVTHPQDLARTALSVRALIDDGTYPAALWPRRPLSATMTTRR